MSSTQGGSRRLWDWRFIVSLTLLLALVFVIITSINAQRNSATKDKQIAALIAQNTRDTAKSHENQDHLLADQHALLTYTAALAQRQRQILRYLLAHHLKVPQALLAPITPPDLSTSDSSSSATTPPRPEVSHGPKAVVTPTPQHPRPHAGAGTPSHAPKPRPTSTSTPHPSPSPGLLAPLAPLLSALPVPLPPLP